MSSHNDKLPNEQSPIRCSMRRGPIGVCKIALTVLAVSPLVLDPAFAAEARQGSQIGALEEVVVKARKRDERFLDIPESISVFGEAAIQDAGIDNIQDVASLAPSLYFSGDWSPGFGTMSMRGISNNPNADAPIAFVVDGVALANSFLLGQDLYDIQQIEVLRGPQGALYGRGAVAGAINIQTKAPTNDREYSVDAMAGRGSTYRLKASASGPIVEDKLLYRISGKYLDTDGILDNEYLNDPVDFREEKSVRLRLLYYATDSLTADFRASHVEADHGGTYWSSWNVPEALGLPQGEIQSDWMTHGSTDVDDYALKLDWETGIGTLTSITSYQDISIPRQVDITFVPLSITEASIDPEDAELFTQELRLTSPDDQDFRWLLGGFYQTSERSRSINVWLNTNSLAGNFNPEEKILIQVAELPAELENTVKSVFGQVAYDISPELELSLAVRYDEDKREDVLNGFKETFDDTQPKLTLRYTPSNNLMFYATYSEGFRSGGFNTNPTFGRIFDQEELTNYELGFKHAALDNTLVLTGAVYFEELDNPQFYAFSSEEAAQGLVNGESAEVLGGELEVNYNPLPGLDLYAGFSYIDSEITDFGNVPGFDILSAEEVDGNNMLYTPEYSVNLSAQYRQPMADGRYSLFGRVDVDHRGKVYFGPDNIEADGEYQDDLTLLNLRAGVDFDRWSVVGFVNNATDEDYDTFCFIGRFIGNAMGINACQRGRPRMYGVEVSARF